MANPLLLPLIGWARKLRYPTLFKVTAVAFAISVLWPFDPIPFIDEIVLGLGTLLLANWKNRKTQTKETIEGEASEPKRRP